MEYEYKWLPGTLVPQDLAEKLASLYSDQYGKWSAKAARNPGGRIGLSTGRIQKLLNRAPARLAYALLDDRVVGYAIAIQEKVPDYGFISWVTQLVVHEDHRRKNVGKSLLFAIWTFTDHFAWGLLTANPYAIRALEKATRRRCQPPRISRNHRKLKTFALEFVDYVKENTELEVTKEVSRINTEFPTDHSKLDEMLKSVTTPSVPWVMGSLPEGWEWFAFTFQDQPMIGLAPEEVEIMLKSSDQVTKLAYSRMLLNEDHRWAQYSQPEARFIASLPNVAPDTTSIADFGCGTGRHASELGLLGFGVTGVDYLESLIQRARENSAAKKISSVRYAVADCRDVDLGRSFDLVLSLYDVVGSYADQQENVRILRNIVRHTKPGGAALISVMNLELTERRAKHLFSLANNPDELLSLKPSRTMERTGNIFDPEYYMLDRDTDIVYRKEQFEAGTSLPAELIVRDRRYRRGDIEAMCRDAGMDVIWSRLVRAGRWNEELAPDDDRAKAILIYCRKP
jgi:2-polyprenyl-3-methyl-5-hydroxy-6-metoxy-1,4-benzoquinol methylase/GNAT superfamily N-acetyltransferase